MVSDKASGFSPWSDPVASADFFGTIDLVYLI